MYQPLPITLATPRPPSAQTQISTFADFEFKFCKRIGIIIIQCFISIYLPTRQLLTYVYNIAISYPHPLALPTSES